MEQQVFEIMERNGNLRTRASKEITSMVFEFIEWVLLHSCGDVYYLGYDENDTVTFYDVKNDNKCTKNEVFQYWWDNVKNK